MFVNLVEIGVVKPQAAKVKSYVHDINVLIYLALDCGPLQDPVNGRVVIKGTAVSATATYTCDPGFVLIGNSQRECLLSGQWSGQDPTCEGML